MRTRLPWIALAVLLALVATGALMIVNSTSPVEDVLTVSLVSAQGTVTDPRAREQHAADPDWPIHSWTRLLPELAAPSRASLAGKVVVILCFQHW